MRRQCGFPNTFPDLPCSANATTDSNLRYAAYASRLRTILLSAHRYVAYTSDIGESFRPIAHPWLIRGAYGVSWAYLVGDVGHEGYKAYVRSQQILHPVASEVVSTERSNEIIKKPNGPNINQEPGHVPVIEDFRSVMIQRAVFQSVASMGLPAFTIHSIVRYSGRALKNAKNTRIRTYGPIGVCEFSSDSSFGFFVHLANSQATIAWPGCCTLPAIHL